MEDKKTRYYLEKLEIELIEGCRHFYSLKKTLNEENFIILHHKVEWYITEWSEQLENVQKCLGTKDFSCKLISFDKEEYLQDRTIEELLEILLYKLLGILEIYQNGLQASREEGDVCSGIVFSEGFEKCEKALWMLRSERDIRKKILYEKQENEEEDNKSLELDIELV